MLGLGKKKKVEEQDEIEEEVKPKRRKITKKVEEIKDLQPKNKKNRKEPPKPWGKGERILVLSLIFGTAAVAAVLGLSSRSWKLPGLPRIFNNNLGLESTVVLEADEATDVKATLIKDQFHSITSSLTGVYALYVSRLYQDNSYGVLSDEPFNVGNMMNLPVAVAMLIETEEGHIRASATNEIVKRLLSNGDQDTYQDALELVGEERIQELIDEMGMSKTSVADKSTTPADIGKLLKKLWDGRLLNEGHTNLVTEHLTRGDGYISAGLDEEAKVVSVNGVDTHFIGEGGIVYASPQPLVIVIMSKGIIEEEAEMALPRLVEIISSEESDF